MTRILKIQIVHNHSQLLFSIAEGICKKLRLHISTQIASYYTAILSINHKCKLSHKRERNLKGISHCTTKMPLLLSRWDWKCWRMFDLQVPVQFEKILDVYKSMKNSFPRHTLSTTIHPVGRWLMMSHHSPAALESQLVISWVHCWVHIWPMWGHSSYSSSRCQWPSLMNECARIKQLPVHGTQPCNAAMPPLVSMDNLSFESRETFRHHMVTSHISALSLPEGECALNEKSLTEN